MSNQLPEFNTAPQVLYLMQGATDFVSVDFGESASGSNPTGPLNPGEVLTGSVTVGDLFKPTGASALTISNSAVNSGNVYINGRTASAGEAVQFKVVASATQTKGLYKLLITVSSDSSPARTFKKVVRVMVVDS
jgi:hypothetical protein